MSAICGLCNGEIDYNEVHWHLSARCVGKNCPKDCNPDSLNAADHHMKGMFCAHCGRAFCIQGGEAIVKAMRDKGLVYDKNTGAFVPKDKN